MRLEDFLSIAAKFNEGDAIEITEDDGMPGKPSLTTRLYYYKGMDISNKDFPEVIFHTSKAMHGDGHRLSYNNSISE